MSDTSGWIRLHRKIMDWRYYKNPVIKDVFLHLLLTANFKDGESESVKVKRGQCLTGRAKIARETGLTEQNCRTALSRLKSTNEVTIKSTNKGMIVTIVNYDYFNPPIEKSTSTSTSVLTNNQPATNHYIIKKEGNKDKENIINLQSNDDRSGTGEEKKPVASENENRYRFEGEVIKLNHRDFEQWQSNYFGIKNLPEKLSKLDLWLQRNPNRQNGWFHSIPRILAKDHKAALEARPEQPRSVLAEEYGSTRALSTTSQSYLQDLATKLGVAVDE